MRGAAERLRGQLSRPRQKHQKKGRTVLPAVSGERLQLCPHYKILKPPVGAESSPAPSRPPKGRSLTSRQRQTNPAPNPDRRAKLHASSSQVNPTPLSTPKRANPARPAKPHSCNSRMNPMPNPDRRAKPHVSISQPNPTPTSPPGRANPTLNPARPPKPHSCSPQLTSTPLAPRRQMNPAPNPDRRAKPHVSISQPNPTRHPSTAAAATGTTRTSPPPAASRRATPAYPSHPPSATP